jgi:hypothetical protein
MTRSLIFLWYSAESRVISYFSFFLFVLIYSFASARLRFMFLFKIAVELKLISIFSLLFSFISKFIECFVSQYHGVSTLLMCTFVASAFIAWFQNFFPIFFAYLFTFWTIWQNIVTCFIWFFPRDNSFRYYSLLNLDFASVLTSILNNYFILFMYIYDTFLFCNTILFCYFWL